MLLVVVEVIGTGDMRLQGLIVVPIHLGIRREHDDLVACVREIALDQVLPMPRMSA